MQRRKVLDDVKTITAYAEEMNEFLSEKELTERRAFIESFVKEIVVSPGNAVFRCPIPTPQVSQIPGRFAEGGGPSRIAIVKYFELTRTVQRLFELVSARYSRSTVGLQRMLAVNGWRGRLLPGRAFIDRTSVFLRFGIA